MDKRYQVFVSSTYEDLQEERQEVMRALLELNCIPIGMELFPASDDDSWTLIRKVIDDADYYIVIIGGRYGSTTDDGISYTEREYRYALDQKKPIMGFLHKKPDELPQKKCEDSKEGRVRLEKFRKLAQQKACKFWISSADLGSVVSRSLVQTMQSHPAIGWVKASAMMGEEASHEIVRLSKRVHELEDIVTKSVVQSPPGADLLAQGKDPLSLRYEIKIYRDQQSFSTHSLVYTTSWDTLFSSLLPAIFGGCNEAKIRAVINGVLTRSIHRDGLTESGKDLLEESVKYYLQVFVEDVETVVVQLRALGLIVIQDMWETWTLTPLGNQVLYELKAVKRQVE